MERPRIGVEHQRQEVAVALPEIQLLQLADLHPFERAFRIVTQRLAAETGDDEQEPEPVLAVFAKSGPTDRAPQAQIEAFDARLFPDLAGRLELLCSRASQESGCRARRRDPKLSTRTEHDSIGLLARVQIKRPLQASNPTSNVRTLDSTGNDQRTQTIALQHDGLAGVTIYILDHVTQRL
jgi:hypothetical protein